MDLSSPIATRADIVREARALIDVPFRHQGRTREGIDCAGVVIYIARKLGVSAFDVSGYRARPDGRTMKEHCDREMLRVPLDAFGVGHVVLFRNVESVPQHLAVVGDYFAGGLSLIHAYEPNGRVLETRLDAAWKHFLVASYALPGVA